MEMIGFHSNRVGEEPNNVQHTNTNNTDPVSNPPQPQPPPPPPPQPLVRYGECQKNHAANVGGHVTDGCGEFMPSGEEGLKCAACDCHRSFHRRVAEGGFEPPASGIATAPYYPYNLHMSNNNLSHNRAILGQFVPPPPPPLAAPRRSAVPPVMMTFGGGAAAESSSEELDLVRMNHGGGGQSSSKRFRTKFTPEQKGRMHEFAERIGWKIQKQNEIEVQQFCVEAGVKRQVFKVWMHNCNQASKKKQS